jgi:hypothetical protein
VDNLMYVKVLSLFSVEYCCSSQYVLKEDIIIPHVRDAFEKSFFPYLMMSGSIILFTISSSIKHEENLGLSSILTSMTTLDY